MKVDERFRVLCVTTTMPGERLLLPWFMHRQEKRNIHILVLSFPFSFAHFCDNLNV
jgi:hypothetical protein